MSKIGWAPSVISGTWHLIDEKGVRCRRCAMYVMQEISSEPPNGARKCGKCAIFYEREARRRA